MKSTAACAREPAVKIARLSPRRTRWTRAPRVFREPIAGHRRHQRKTFDLFGRKDIVGARDKFDAPAALVFAHLTVFAARGFEFFPEEAILSVICW